MSFEIVNILIIIIDVKIFASFITIFKDNFCLEAFLEKHCDKT